MVDIEVLEDKFSIEGELGFAELEEGMVFITISNKYADADICLYGAQVTGFRPYNTLPVLWVSPDSFFEVGKPIRGGIPVCFPWFGLHKTDPEKPQHGFARLLYWDVVETGTNPVGETFVRLQLSSSEETKKLWPYDFLAEVSITVGLNLIISLKIENTSGGSFEYSSALHSYFELSSIENIAIEGLQGTKYFDQLDQKEYFQEESVLELKKAETRHYLNTESTCIIEDSIFNRRIQVEKSGSKVTTVWNPGEETCAKIEDLPDEAYQVFVCVETVNAFNDTICLVPGESHVTTATIGLVR